MLESSVSFSLVSSVSSLSISSSNIGSLSGIPTKLSVELGDGFPVGEEVSIILFFIVGLFVELLKLVGLFVLPNVGFGVGPGVGNLVVLKDTLSDGAAVSGFLGPRVGRGVGSLVGPSVGSLVGPSVGSLVGSGVGSLVGPDVGLKVDINDVSGIDPSVGVNILIGSPTFETSYLVM